MSDTQQGPDWWLATDGKWYPPAARAASPPDPPDEAAPAGKRPAWMIPAIVAVVVIVGLGVFMLVQSGSTTKTVEGTFTVISDDFGTAVDRPCFPSGGYGDIGPGTEVKVSDEAGTLLATSRLGSGTTARMLLGGTGCQFDFDVELKKGSEFYRFEVGRRGELSYTWDELIDMDFLVEFSLG